MTLVSRSEEAALHYDENGWWTMFPGRPINDLEGEWVNADCSSEQYVVQGLTVTRTDWRGTQNFTLQWDQQRQQWSWGTHGKLYLEWRANDTIAWVPNVPSKNSRVWQWRRLIPSPAGRGLGGDVPMSAFDVPSYGPSRRLRINHHCDQPYPHQSISNPWSAPPNYIPHRSCATVNRHERTQRSWDSSDGSYQGEAQECRRSEYWHSQRDQRYQRDSRNFHSDYYGYHPRRPRVDPGYYNRLPCGLSSNEVYSLLHREITPEDYDLLLLLDEGVKKPTASEESVAALRKVLADEFMGAECSVCLTPFAEDDAVAALPCGHIFHRSCVTKWLSECRRMCPLCGAEVASPETVPATSV